MHRTNRRRCVAAEIRFTNAAADVYQHGAGQLLHPGLLRRRCEATLKVLLGHRNAFMLRHQDLLLRALQAAE